MTSTLADYVQRILEMLAYPQTTPHQYEVLLKKFNQDREIALLEENFQDGGR